jgi:DNA-directed RNA polymerase subunit RPC12/RpoP
MPVMRTYQCPDCEGFFDHLHMRSTEEPPNRCPLCGADTSGTAPELSAPHIPRLIGKVADGVYRAMEDSSLARAEMAAETLGESVSDMSAMRVTNIRDDARPGENSVVTTANPVSTYMQTTKQGGLQGGDGVAEALRHTRTGLGAGSGVRMMQQVTGNHARVAPRVVAAGNQGVHRA